MNGQPRAWSKLWITSSLFLLWIGLGIFADPWGKLTIYADEVATATSAPSETETPFTLESATATLEPAATEPVPPPDTETPTLIASETASETPTATASVTASPPEPLPATETATETATAPIPPTATETPTETPTETETASETSTATTLPPTASDTPSPTPTSSPAASETPTAPALSETSTPTETAPIAPITPPLTPTVTLSPTVTASPVVTHTPTLTATVLPPIMETETPTHTATPTPPVATPAGLRISEFLADPAAVSDTNGEWIELFNPTDSPVNLFGWILADLGSDRHVIAEEVWIAPQGYLVLARNTNLATNGGVAAAYRYTGINLANTTDALLLLAPDQQEVDRVMWGGGSPITIVAGKANERLGWAGDAPWAHAETLWPGSLGDRGTPGSPYSPPAPTATATFPPTPSPVASITQTVTLTTATPAITPTPTMTATPVDFPSLRISEFLADPAAVSDTAGEWIELYNPSAEPVNLRGWALSGLDGQTHLIAADLLIPPAGYAVLARNLDPASNGGVLAAYRYSGITLNNTTDSLLLLAPDGREIDRVLWGNGSELAVTVGASLERTDWADPTAWAVASGPWPGSAGDRGTPGAAYLPPPPTPTSVATMPPAASATATPPLGPPAALVISEFLADPQAVGDNGGEWIELHNPTAAPVNLRGWYLDQHQIQVDLIIPAGGYLVLARHGDPTVNGNVVAHYIYSGISLANTIDSLQLLAPDGTQVDAVAWGGDSGLRIRPGYSYERDPNGSWQLATSPWPGSMGDRGTPGSAYLPPPATATPTPPPLPSAAPSTPSGPPPSLRISEFLADPKTVDDPSGEWIELYNPTEHAVNLRGWILADEGSERHIIATDLIIPPSGYLLLARNGDPARNGGITPHYLYSGFSLANGDDEILLLSPTGSEVDRVMWGGDNALDVVPGRSIERIGATEWGLATQPWPGSAGDWGTPGSAPLPLPATPTPLPGTPTPLSGAATTIRISEFLADPKAVDDRDGEWIELYNTGSEPVNLRDWVIADLGRERYTIKTDLWIGPGLYLVLARNGDFSANGGVLAHHVYTGLALGNQQDALLLIAPDGNEVDRVVWGGDSGLKPRAGMSLERHLPADPSVWEVATTSWPSSAGDLGSPGDPYRPAPTSTPSPPAVPPLQPGQRTIWISEFLADPKAVSDSNGEWIELYNSGSETVNLRGWVLTDLGGERHTISADLLIAPGAYVLLARNGDAATNGGVTADYLYQGFSLANNEDEIMLLAPDGSEIDRVLWGGDSGLAIKAGKSLERTTFAADAAWALATTAWPNSAGDLGTPRAAYVPGATPLPTTTATPTPGPWPVATTAAALVIDEVLYRGSDQEFVALLNLGATPIDLTGWSVGDAQRARSSEGMLALPSGYLLGPGETFVIARDGAAFRNRWGRAAHAESSASDPDTPDLARRRDLATGSFTLSDSGDEVVLLNPAGELVDAVAFGKGDYAALGLSGLLQAPAGYSLQRVPEARFPAVSDVRHRFLFAPPRPFEPRGLPLAQIHPPTLLDHGLQAVWGSLGGQSNFSTGLTAPPHYLLAAAGAHGLDFLAIADPGPTSPWRPPNGVIHVPAWHWQGAAGERAIFYNTDDDALADRAALMAHLAATGVLAQWQGKEPPDAASLTTISGDTLAVPDGLANFYKATWAGRGQPLLPVGNSNPPLPGAVDPSPRYTGLAVTAAEPASILAAVAERRGWLTSAPGLWLTLQAQLTTGEHRWMGSLVPASNQITLEVHYGDRSGEVAGLAIWQDNRPVHQLTLPAVDGRWSVTLPAAPGSIFYAVATQADGDFAVTAPIQIALETDGVVLLNEVLPAPAVDHNEDGKIDGDDEFIELYNPGTQPVSLAGWQLSDNTGDANPARRFVFPAGSILQGGEYLLLWRQASWINLNIESDFVRLLRPDGTEADFVGWGERPPRTRSLSRFPDGQAWINDARVTPGLPNDRVILPAARSSEGGGGGPAPDAQHSRYTPIRSGGWVGTVAGAKPWGLKVFVEFDAIVTVPPGLFGRTIYVADPADSTQGPIAGSGIHLYLAQGEYPPLQEGDRIRVGGVLSSYRGELELYVREPSQIIYLGSGPSLRPLATTAAAIGEPLEGRLVTFQGIVTGWQEDSIYLADPAQPTLPAVRVVIRDTVGWRRPYVNKGDLWAVTGVVSQLAWESPWNGSYRVNPRYEQDLVRIRRAQALR